MIKRTVQITFECSDLAGAVCDPATYDQPVGFVRYLGLMAQKDEVTVIEVKEVKSAWERVQEKAREIVNFKD